MMPLQRSAQGVQMLPETQHPRLWNFAAFDQR
jgi:hypothetical protein